jgi:hypothetical protein
MSSRQTVLQAKRYLSPGSQSSDVSCGPSYTAVTLTFHDTVLADSHLGGWRRRFSRRPLAERRRRRYVNGHPERGVLVCGLGRRLHGPGFVPTRDEWTKGGEGRLRRHGRSSTALLRQKEIPPNKLLGEFQSFSFVFNKSYPLHRTDWSVVREFY